MSMQRATFAVTCDTNGMGSADVTLKLPSELTRHAFLEAVTVDRSAAFAAAYTITLSELLDVSTATWNPTPTVQTTAVDRQLFHIDGSSIALSDGVTDEYSPRHLAEDVYGVESSLRFAERAIRAKKVRCEVYGGISGDVFTVNMYYETAGDFRF
jgi:hypothetical protein